MKKTLNYNTEAENAIIACLYCGDENIIEEIFLRLSEGDFWHDSNKQLFAICYSLWKNKKPIDIPASVEMIGHITGMITELTGKIQSLVSTANYNTHINILQKNTAARTLEKIAEELKEEAPTDPFKARDKAIAGLSGISEGTETGLEHISASVDEAATYITEVIEGKRPIEGVKTPFKRLNYYISNFQNGEITIVAARPGVGKSAFVNEIILGAALKEKKKVALFNLEMSKQQIALRMYSNILNKSLKDITSGKVNVAEIAAAGYHIRDAEIYVNVDAYNVEQITRACRIQKKRSGLDLVCIDYLQLIGSKNKYKDRRAEVEYVSLQIKRLAKELGIPFVVLSQMSRDVEKNDREPVLSDLRESGTIEQDATHVVFLHRDKKEEIKLGYKDGERYLKIMISKNRNGATGDIYMRFEADKMRFVEIGQDGKEISKPVLRPLANEQMPF